MPASDILALGAHDVLNRALFSFRGDVFEPTEVVRDEVTDEENVNVVQVRREGWARVGCVRYNM
jgi:hypothetical protein